MTQEQWRAVMGTQPGPAERWRKSEWKALPVVSVSWDDIQTFLRRLTALEPGVDYRLPSEAEWEYAARADSSGIRPMPEEDLPRYAWYIDNSGDMPHAAARLAPNAWGLYDMLSNAWEWVADP